MLRDLMTGNESRGLEPISLIRGAPRDAALDSRTSMLPAPTIGNESKVSEPISLSSHLTHNNAETGHGVSRDPFFVVRK